MILRKKKKYSIIYWQTSRWYYFPCGTISEEIKELINQSSVPVISFQAQMVKMTTSLQ